MSRASDLQAQLNALRSEHELLALRYESIAFEHQRLSRKEEFLESQLLAMTMLTKSRTLANGNLQTALQEITRSCARTLEVDRVGVWIIELDERRLRCADLFESNGHRHSQGQTLDFHLFPSYMAEILKDRVVDAHDAMTDPRTLELTPAYLAPLRIRSMLDVPVRARGDMMGILCHEHFTPRHWHIEEIHFASFAASLITLALESRARVEAQESLRRFKLAN